MKKFLRVIIPAALLLLTPAVGFAYQVTGPVLEVSDTKIVVQKGKEKWEIARDASTKVTGDLKVGSKVTIEYKMTATSVDVKTDAKAAAKPAKTK
ncbi:MAG: hypothetical protein ACHQM4_02910 [Thermoanaerobaculia bacterium]